MKIAYYEENDYHTEILGTFLEIYNQHQITVFNNKDKSDYINYFKTIINFELVGTDNFFERLYDFDIIIIGTFSECLINKLIWFYTDFTSKNIINTNSKIYAVCHLKEDVEQFNKIILTSKINFHCIILTPLNNSIQNKYILPLNCLYREENKNYNSDCVTIGIIGRFKDDNRNIDDIVKLVKSHSKLRFKIRIFARHIKFIPDKITRIKNEFPEKIDIVIKAKTNDIIKQIKNINYLCPFTSKNSWYLKDRLTGIIPFALNFNTPLILDKETSQIYNLNSPLIYNESITEIIDNIVEVSEHQYTELVKKTIEEKNLLVKTNIDTLLNK